MVDLSKSFVDEVDGYFTNLHNAESGAEILSNLEAAFERLAAAKRVRGVVFSQSFHDAAKDRCSAATGSAAKTQVWLLDALRNLLDLTSELLYSDDQKDQVGAVRLLMKVVQHEASVRVQKATSRGSGLPGLASTAKFPRRLFDCIVITILHAAGLSRPEDAAATADAAVQMIDSRLECLVEYAATFVDIRLSLFNHLIDLTSRPAPPQLPAATACGDTVQSISASGEHGSGHVGRKRSCSAPSKDSTKRKDLRPHMQQTPKATQNNDDTRWVVSEFFSGGILGYDSWRLTVPRLSAVTFYLLSRLPLQQQFMSKGRTAGAAGPPASDSDNDDFKFSNFAETSDKNQNLLKGDSITATIAKMESDNYLDSDDDEMDMISAAAGDEEEQAVQQKVIVKVLCDGCSNASKNKNPAVHRRVFQLAWRKYLSLAEYYTYVRRMTLQYLPRNVLPYLPDPIAVASFFTLTFNDSNIADCVLAVSGLFYLLLHSKLGDTDAKFQFSDEENDDNRWGEADTARSGDVLTSSAVRQELYSRLYSLLQPALFTLACRARFLRLLNAALRSSYLSSCMVACFIKKCLRTATLVNAPSAVWLIALAHDLLLRHKTSCQSLIHHTPAKQIRRAAPRAAPSDSAADHSAAAYDIWVDSDTEEDDTSSSLTVDAVAEQQQPSSTPQQPSAASTAARTVNSKQHATSAAQDSDLSTEPTAAPQSVVEDGDKFDYLRLSVMDDKSRRRDEFSKWSLWELELLKRHCSPDVAGLTDIFYSAGQRANRQQQNESLDPDSLVALSKGDLIRRTWAACVRQLVDSGVEPAHNPLPAGEPDDVQRLLRAVLV